MKRADMGRDDAGRELAGRLDVGRLDVGRLDMGRAEESARLAVETAEVGREWRRAVCEAKRMLSCRREICTCGESESETSVRAKGCKRKFVLKGCVGGG